MKCTMKSFLLPVMAAIPFFANAQTIIVGNSEYKTKNPQAIEGKVFYDFVYLKDTAQPDNLYKEEYELDFGKTASMFKSYTAALRDSSMAAQVKQQFKTAPDPNHVTLTLRVNGNTSNEMFYTEISNTPCVYTLKNVASALFYIKDTQPKIGWQILDSTKDIQGNLCQKAVGKSHGRIYTAWFCSDIPYSFGPRKLNGLPGLILEAYDEKREVVYTLNRLQRSVTGEIGLPDAALPATDGEYKKASEAFKKNPSAFMNEHPRSGTPAKNPMSDIDESKIAAINIIKESGDHNKTPLKENNPIDLK